MREIFDLVEELGKCSFEIGPIRPPSEGGSHSLLIRVSRNCPWRLCTFCYGTPYNREKFQLRTVEEIKRDLDNIKKMSDLIKEISLKLGFGGKINGNLGKTILYLDATLSYNPSFINVFNWFYSGAKTVFLQDADSLIIPTQDLIEVIRYLKTLFPQIERITSYARAKTITRKTIEDLKNLKQAGLSRLHLGLETGDDELLKRVNKGVTSKELVEAGRKIIESGIELSEYVMPGLGGKSMSEQHAKNTARVLNEINPHYIRMRTFVPLPHTPLYEEYKEGKFKLLSPHECLLEIKLMIEELNVTSKITFDHFINPSFKGDIPIFRQSYEGYKLPEEKETILETIEKALKVEESKLRWTEELIGIQHL